MIGLLIALGVPAWGHGLTGIAQIFSRSCQSGHVMDCNNLGYLYAHGQSVQRNSQRAKKLFLRACRGQYASGCLNMGLMYLHGNGISKNDPLARHYFQQTCKLKDSEGCYFLGKMDLRRKTPKALQKAKKLFEKGCFHRFAPSCYELARMDENHSYGSQKKLVVAREFYGKSCQMGWQKGCIAYHRLSKRMPK